MLFDTFKVKQPMFGANYVKGDVISEADGKLRVTSAKSYSKSYLNRS